jgi:hypothetical protein
MIEAPPKWILNSNAIYGVDYNAHLFHQAFAETFTIILG